MKTSCPSRFSRLCDWYVTIRDWNRRDDERAQIAFDRFRRRVACIFRVVFFGASASAVKKRTGSPVLDRLVKLWYDYWQLNYRLETWLWYPEHPYVAKTCRVRSEGEKLIANWLTDRGIKFVYEKKLRLGRKRLLPDFFLKEYDCYVEYWGLAGASEKYDARRIEKLALYRQHHVRVISLYPNHLRRGKKSLDVVFPALFAEVVGRPMP